MLFSPPRAAQEKTIFPELWLDRFRVPHYIIPNSKPVIKGGAECSKFTHGMFVRIVKKTVDWLQNHKIPFQYLEIEEQPEEVIRQVVDANGGVDWVVPTLEYNGQWRPGQMFDPIQLEADLRAWHLL